MARTDAVPRYRVERLRDAAPFPSFAAYVERCLYDPDFGYYSTGKVVLSPGGHFGTYPQLLRPMFGHLLAEAARELFEALDAAGALPQDEPFTVLELGGGDGTLASQTLDYVASRADQPRWRGVADRCQQRPAYSSRRFRLGGPTSRPLRPRLGRSRRSRRRRRRVARPPLHA